MNAAGPPQEPFWRRLTWPDWFSFGRHHRLILASVLILVLGGVGIRFGAWPLYTRWQTSRMLAQGRAALQKQDMRLAALAYQKAIEYRPVDPKVWRAVAEGLEQANSPQAVDAWRWASNLAPGDLSARLGVARSALARGKPDLAAEALNKATPEQQQSVDWRRAAAQWALAMNRAPEALGYLEAVLAQLPEDRQARRQRAALLINAPDAQAAAAARADLEKLSQLAPEALADPQDETRQALRALAVDALRRNAPGEAARWAGMLADKPNAPFGDRMLALHARTLSADPAAATLLAQLKTAAAPDAPALYEMTQWLLRQNQAAQAREWLLGLAPGTDAPITLVQTRATALAETLGTLGRWSELPPLLEKQRWQGAEHVRLLLLLRAYREMGARDRAAAAWNQIVEVIGDRLEWQQAAAQMLAQWGWANEYEQVLLRMLERFPDYAQGYRQLEAFYLQQKNVPALRRVLARHVRIEPQDPSVQANAAMLELLGEGRGAFDPVPAGAIARRLEPLLAKYPGHAMLVTAYGFALLRQGRAGEAVQAFETLPDEARREPARALYYGLALRAAGQARTARTYLRLAQQADLLPPERELLAQAAGF